MASGTVSLVLLWVVGVMILQGVTIYALARQIGVLHESALRRPGAMVSGAGPGGG